MLSLLLKDKKYDFLISLWIFRKIDTSKIIQENEEIVLNIKQFGFTITTMGLKYADGMANSVDTYQTTGAVWSLPAMIAYNILSWNAEVYGIVFPDATAQGSKLTVFSK